MNALLLTFVSTFLISLISLIVIFAFLIKDKFLNKILDYFVALSIGALIGAAFLDLIPEAIGLAGYNFVFLYVIGGFLLFYVIEKVLHWRHCHDPKCQQHSTFAYINLVGESVHNFIDGLIIAASFIINPAIGLSSVLAIGLHEIPHEIGNFSVLLYAGFSKKKALLFNFITAATAIIGGLVGYFIFNQLNNALVFLIPIAAGGFIYISASDLIPEIRKEENFVKSLLHVIIMLLGILMIYLIRSIS